LVGVFFGVTLGNLDEVRDRIESYVETFDFGNQGLISACVLEAVDCCGGVDAR
jgi:hypothetical protein